MIVPLDSCLMIDVLQAADLFNFGRLRIKKKLCDPQVKLDNCVGFVTNKVLLWACAVD